MNMKAPLRFPSSAGPNARKPDASRDLTRERLAEHLAQFQQNGGTVEVLGNTPLQRFGGKAPTPTT